MLYEKQNWISYDDNKTEEENIQAGAVVTAERMNHLENGIAEHDKNVSNPHKVTKAQIGLENVDNVKQASKSEFDLHLSNKSNPHNVTATQVGLGNVDNYSTATQVDAEVGTANNLFMTPLRVFQAITKWVDGKFISKTGTETVSGIKNFQDGLQSAGKEVSTIDQLNLYGIYGEGANQSKFPAGSKIPMGKLVATDFAHTESDLPYTISSDRITLTATRDCVLFFEGAVKIHGDNTLKYAYVKIRKNGSDTNFASLGSGANFNYMTIQHGQQVHTLKKGDKVEFTLEAASGGVLFATQFISMKITEVKPL